MIVSALTAVTLVLRWLFMSNSLDEIDSSLFYNALAYGFDVAKQQPHPPGYPVYVFIADLFAKLTGDMTLGLIMPSVVFGSLSVAPLYLLARSLAGRTLGLLTALLFVANPLLWMYSEAALADALSMSFVVIAVLLAYVGVRSNPGFVFACICMAIAIGVRQSNLSLLPVLLVPVGVRLICQPHSKKRIALLVVMGAACFLATVALWLLPLLRFSGGLEGYLSISAAQLEGLDSSIADTRSPVLYNGLLRVLRFTVAYLFTYPWLAADGKGWLAVLALPPAIGLLAFLTSIRLRNSGDILILFWLLGYVYVLLQIHFLPRYVLPYLPAALVAAVIGYSRLARLMTHAFPNGIMVLVLCALSATLVLSFVQVEPPFQIFETGTDYHGVSHVPGLILISLAFICLLAAVVVFRIAYRVGQGRQAGNTSKGMQSLAVGALGVTALAGLGVSLTVLPIAHSTPSPQARYLELLTKESRDVPIASLACAHTWGFFRAFAPPTVQDLGMDPDSFYRAFMDRSQTVIVSSDCPADLVADLTSHLGMSQAAVYAGGSLLWSKQPSITAYKTIDPTLLQPSLLRSQTILASSFEEPSEWNLQGGTWNSLLAEPRTGVRALSLDSRGGAMRDVRSRELTGVESGRPYEVGAWVRSGDGRPAMYKMTIEWVDGGRHLGYSADWEVWAKEPATPEWTFVRRQVQAPSADVTHAHLLLGTASGSWVLVDDLVFRQVGEDLLTSDIDPSFSTTSGWTGIDGVRNKHIPEGRQSTGSLLLDHGSVESPTSVTSQPIVILPSESYVVGGWVRGNAGSGTFKIAVCWFDMVHTPLGCNLDYQDWSQIRLRSQWAPAVRLVHSPENARYAYVVLDAGRQSAVIIDDVFFRPYALAP